MQPGPIRPLEDHDLRRRAALRADRGALPVRRLGQRWELPGDPAATWWRIYVLSWKISRSLRADRSMATAMPVH